MGPSRERPLTFGRALLAVVTVGAIAATVLAPLASAPAARAQTPYDVAEPPPSAPIAPEPDPSTPTPAPSTQSSMPALPDPPVPLTLPAPGPFGAAAATVEGVPVVVVIRDPSQPVRPDDPLLALLPSTAVLGDGTRLLLPVGPGGSSREVDVSSLRIIEMPGLAELVAVEGDDGVIRTQLTNGALRADRGEVLLVVVGGLAPGTPARLVLFSDPYYDLGTSIVPADGTLTAAAPLPEGIAAGRHMLQLDAVRADGVLVSVGQRIDVAAVGTTEPAVPVAPPVVPAPDAGDEPAARPAWTWRLILAILLLILAVVVRRYAARTDRADEDATPTPVTTTDGTTAAAKSPERVRRTRRSRRARRGRRGWGTWLVPLVAAAGAVVTLWVALGGATLTRPRVESLVALVALQWLGLRIVAGTRAGGGASTRGGSGSRSRGVPLDDVLAAAAGLTFGTGVHLILDAWLDAVPLLSGVAGPHLPVGVTLGVLALAVTLTTAVLLTTRRSRAARTDRGADASAAGQGRGRA